MIGCTTFQNHHFCCWIDFKPIRGLHSPIKSFPNRDNISNIFEPCEIATHEPKIHKPTLIQDISKVFHLHEQSQPPSTFFMRFLISLKSPAHNHGTENLPYKFLNKFHDSNLLCVSGSP